MNQAVVTLLKITLVIPIGPIVSVEDALAPSIVPYLFARGKFWYDFFRRQFVVTTPALLAGGLFFLPFYYIKSLFQLEPREVALMGTALFFPFATILGVLHGYAARNNQSVKDAMGFMQKSHIGIMMQVNDVAKAELRNACYVAYILYLRWVYSVMMGFEVVAKYSNSDREFKTIGSISQHLQAKLRQANIAASIVSGNGVFHASLTGWATAQVAVNYLIPFSMYVTVFLLFLIADSVLALFVSRLGLQNWWFGSSVMGLFTYAISLVVVLAVNQVVPLGRRNNQINPHRVFRELEESAQEGAEVAEIERDLEAKQKQLTTD